MDPKCVWFGYSIGSHSHAHKPNVPELGASERTEGFGSLVLLTGPFVLCDMEPLRCHSENVPDANQAHHEGTRRSWAHPHPRLHPAGFWDPV